MFYTDGLKIIYCTKWFLGKYFTWDTSLHVKEINLFNIMFLSDNRSLTHSSKADYLETSVGPVNWSLLRAITKIRDWNFIIHGVISEETKDYITLRFGLAISIMSK